MQYGYKIGGFASQAKFDEAEWFIDLLMKKKFVKGHADFSEDGSRTQEWVRSDDSGEQKIVLIKNITESAVIVFSDCELKWLKFGGKLLYLRDIIPMLLFALMFWKLVPFVSAKYRIVDNYLANGFFMSVICGLGGAIVCLIANLLIRIRRDPVRSLFVRLGGVFSILQVLYFFIKPVFITHAPFSSFFGKVFYNGPGALLIAMIFLWVASKFKKD